MLDLELATNAELVAELMRRTTFRGLVAWQETSFTGKCRSEWQWRVNNCDGIEISEGLAKELQKQKL